MFVFQPVITTYKVLAENGSLRLVRKYIQFLISLVFFFVLFCFFFCIYIKFFIQERFSRKVALQPFTL